MIEQQLSLPGLNDQFQDDWTNDDWESPPEIAAAIARLVKVTERIILEPSGGTGRLLLPFKDLDKKVTAVEIKQWRVMRGKVLCPWVSWVGGDFLLWDTSEKFDLIIGNLPFSQPFTFIERSLQLLKPAGRMLFLLPIDFYCGVKANAKWRQLDCHIYRQHTIAYRVPYINAQGKPQKGRQVYDAVFDLRPGKDGGSILTLD